MYKTFSHPSDSLTRPPTVKEDAETWGNFQFYDFTITGWESSRTVVTRTILVYLTSHLDLVLLPRPDSWMTVI